MIDFAVISPVLVRNVELTLDLDAPFAPHSSICLKLHLSIGHITLTSQIRPPPMPWEPEGDVKPVVAIEIWNGLESTNPVGCREQGPCPVLRASVVFRTFGAVSYFLQPRSKPGYGGSQPTGAFCATCGRRWIDLQLGHHIGWKPLVVGVPGFEIQASQVAILGATRLLLTPLRDGGTQFQHGWRTAPLSLSLRTLVRSCNCRTFSKS